MRILAWCDETGTPVTDSKARRLGVRIARRADAMQREFDFYEALRILGMTTDTTARDAVRNIERNAR